MWDFAREERGVAYLSVILLTTLLFAWVTFQLERVVQHHQTVHDDTAMIQAQYAAESGIEYMRSILRDQGDVDPLTVTLQTGEAAVEVVRRDPLRIRAVGRVGPHVQQTVTVELDPDTFEVVKWMRQTE